MTNTLSDFLDRLDPKTRKRFKVAQEVVTEKLPSASIEFNYATGGGFPRGAVTTIFGNYSSSKTALTLQTIGELQKQGQICAFVDAESTFDRDWATRLGVDTSSLILIRKRSFGAIVDEIRPLLEIGIDFLVWDSISQTLPEVFIDDKSGELKEFSGQKQIGAASRSAGIAINAMHYINDRTAIVLISQTRTDMSGMHPMQKPTNGKAVEFGSSLMVKLTGSSSDKMQLKGKVKIGDSVHEVPVGRTVNIEVTKNKVGPPNRVGKYNFYYSGDYVGIDNVDELVSMAKRFGVLEPRGPWIAFDGETRWQGQEKLVKELKADQALFDLIKSRVESLEGSENEQLEELPAAE